MKKNPQLKTLVPSATLALNQKAKMMQSQGMKVYNFTAGEPDFPTPKRICDAAKDAMDKGYTKYTPAAGISQLRQAIANKYTRECKRDHQASHVMVSNGGKQVLFNLFFSFLAPEDEVILFAPYWVSYKSLVEMCGGKAIVIDTQPAHYFVPSIDQIKSKISDRTRFIVVNSPCNPTGSVYPKSFLDDLSMLLKDHPNLICVSDDMYENFVFDPCSFDSLARNNRLNLDQLVIVNGVSKSFSMTGWRIGYAVANKEIIDMMTQVQSQSTSNASSISQWAALEAIEGSNPQEQLAMKNIFQKRRDLIYKKIKEIPSLSCLLPDGAFYLFVDFRKVLERVQGNNWSDIELAQYFLEEYQVAMVPGSAFGSPGFMRLSYGLSDEDIVNGVDRLHEGLKSLESLS